MNYSLDREELRQLIEYKHNNQPIDDEHLKTIIFNSECWEDELCCINYIFSKILERIVKGGRHGKGLINLLYEIEDSMFFIIQEVDYNYIEFMMRNNRIIGLSLEEDMIMLQNNYRGHIYDASLRN